MKNPPSERARSKSSGETILVRDYIKKSFHGEKGHAENPKTLPTLLGIDAATKGIQDKYQRHISEP